ncbi:MAG: nucleotide exchange factor GrpE, partial [Eubacterium sp.]|nr:nucleotide exchange factor GrpE [Eubacterium sp.]
LAAAKDSYLRTAAEYANYRARSAKEKEQSFTNAKCSVVAEILPVIDNLERAIGAENGDYDALKKGVQMTLDGLMASFEKLGVESFGESGDSFDPNYHNAVMHVEDESLGENTITDVFQKGYKIGDRVIRAAMVKTAN